MRTKYFIVKVKHENNKESLYIYKRNHTDGYSIDDCQVLYTKGEGNPVDFMTINNKFTMNKKEKLGKQIRKKDIPFELI